MKETDMNETAMEDHLIYVLTRSGCEQSELADDVQSQILEVYKILVLVIAPINVLLNGISLKIFGHRLWKGNSTSSILKSLSVFEICFASSLFLHSINSRVLENFIHLDNETTALLTEDERTNKARLIASLLVFGAVLSCSLFAFQIARNWSVVILAAYRYEAICRKIGTMTSFPPEKIPWIMSATMLLCGLFALPRLFEVKSFICVPTSLIYYETVILAQYEMYRLLYLGIGTFIVQSGGPVICVCVLSFFVIRKIALRRKFRRQNQRTVLITASKNESTSDNEPQEVTKTVERKLPSGDKLMLALCFMFFLLETPSFFSKILVFYIAERYPTLDLYLSVIANLLIYLDSTVNVFVYMGSNPTFRTVAKIMFGRKRGNKQTKINSSRSTKSW